MTAIVSAARVGCQAFTRNSGSLERCRSASNTVEIDDIKNIDNLKFILPRLQKRTVKSGANRGQTALDVTNCGSTPFIAPSLMGIEKLDPTPYFPVLDALGQRGGDTPVARIEKTRSNFGLHPVEL